MSTTKAEILALLKRHGAHSVSQLAEALQLAPVTIRQHLTRLERDGLIATEQRSNGNGRPHYEYRLSARGHAAGFPRRSDRLVELLVREIGYVDATELTGLSRRGRMAMVVGRVAERLAEEYRPLLERWPLQERVAFVTEVLHTDGGLAEWERTSAGFEIRDYNCLFHRLLADEGQDDACDWHRTFLSRMLGADVPVSPCPEPDAHCCRYEVAEAVFAGGVA